MTSLSLPFGSPAISETFPFLENLPELSVPRDVALSLVQHFLSSAPNLGFYGMIPVEGNLNFSQDGFVTQFSEDFLQPELQCALVAIALELYGHHLPANMQKDINDSRDILQTAALTVTPNLMSTRNNLQPHNALSLLLFSYTWCISEQFTHIASQWCSLAKIILEECAGTIENESRHAVDLRQQYAWLPVFNT